LAAALSACASQPQIYDGIYTWGPEVETFSPCGTGEKQWWVLTSEDLWIKLRDAHQDLAGDTYEGIFVEVMGYYAGPATEERGGPFSIQYEGLFQITKVLFTRKRSTSDCSATASRS